MKKFVVMALFVLVAMGAAQHVFASDGEGNGGGGEDAAKVCIGPYCTQIPADCSMSVPTLGEESGGDE